MINVTELIGDFDGNNTARGGATNIALPVLLVCVLLCLFSSFVSVTWYWQKHRRDLESSAGVPSGVDVQKPPKTQAFIEERLQIKTVAISPTPAATNSVQTELDIESSGDAIHSSSQGGLHRLDTDRHPDDAEICPICLGDFENGQQICLSYNETCSHYFHADCGIAWLSKRSECPVCRATYLVDPESLVAQDADTNEGGLPDVVPQ